MAFETKIFQRHTWDIFQNAFKVYSSGHKMQIFLCWVRFLCYDNYGVVLV